jgi:uncharacterized protein (DUF302 family)
MTADTFFESRTRGTVADVRNRIEASLKASKFGVLHIHDVTATLNARRVEFATPMVIMDVCSPTYAKQALDATANRIAPLLPCSVALWQDGEEVVTRFMRPTMLAAMFPGAPGLEQLAAEVDTLITVAVTEALGNRS